MSLSGAGLMEGWRAKTSFGSSRGTTGVQQRVWQPDVPASQYRNFQVSEEGVWCRQMLVNQEIEILLVHNGAESIVSAERSVSRKQELTPSSALLAPAQFLALEDAVDLVLQIQDAV